MLIKLNKPVYAGRREIVYVNPDHIESVEKSDENSTALYFQNHGVTVDGKVEDVISILKNYKEQ